MASLTNLAIVAVAAFLVQRFLSRMSKAPLPPGPMGLPLIGNVLDMPAEEQWKTFAKWGETYGDLIAINILLGQPIIIANTAEEAYNILDKKSSIYSNRAIMPMAGELVGWTYALALYPFGERFKQIRKLMYKAIGSKATLEQYTPMVELEIHRMLRRIHVSRSASTSVRPLGKSSFPNQSCLADYPASATFQILCEAEKC